MSKIAGDQSIATESVGKVPTDVDGKEKYSSPTETLQEPGNEFGLDYRDEMDSGAFSNFGNKGTWSGLGDYNDRSPSGINGGRYRDGYGSPDVDGYGGLYNDSRRRALSPSTRESLLSGEGDADFFSPRSRYDLACGPSRSPYSSQWDNYDDLGSGMYESLSPRYKMDSGRWGDHEVGSFYDESDRLFSLRERSHFGLNYQSDLDSYPSSYTYGMRHANKYYAAPVHSPYAPPYHSGTSNGDLSFPEDALDPRVADSRCYPFSDPSSPQPMYGLHPEPAGELLRPTPGRLPFGHSVRMKVASPLSSAKKEPPRSTPLTPQTPQTPTTPLTPNPAVSAESGAASEEQQYRIDSQTIMQNREERTVVIIRNIPNRYKLEDLQRVIKSFVDGRQGVRA